MTPAPDGPADRDAFGDGSHGADTRPRCRPSPPGPAISSDVDEAIRAHRNRILRDSIGYSPESYPRRCTGPGATPTPERSAVAAVGEEHRRLRAVLQPELVEQG